MAWRHGTIYGYVKKRCRCDACQRAHRDYRDLKAPRMRSGACRGCGKTLCRCPRLMPVDQAIDELAAILNP